MKKITMNELKATYGELLTTQGNEKLGNRFRCLSMPARDTCPKNATCYRYCYARAIENRFPALAERYNRNKERLDSNSDLFREQLWKELKYFMPSCFRFNVDGDIYDMEYMALIHEAAEKFPGIDFLVFTKQYDIVNRFYDELGELDNLHINFSMDDGLKMDNPHNFPTVTVFKSIDDVPHDYAVCSGNCSECHCMKFGCFNLKKGDKLALLVHGAYKNNL